MKKLITTSLCIIIISCIKTDIIQHDSWNQDPFTKASGYQVNRLSRSYNTFSGNIFLSKYDETMWADTENYYGNFSDIKFESHGPVFITVFSFGKEISYCKVWPKAKNTSDEIKWNIQIKKDEEDELWFEYNYYGTSQEIEYTITYKYEIIDGLLHFSNTEGQKFIFHPSDKNYTRELIDTDEIIEQEGCRFL